VIIHALGNLINSFPDSDMEKPGNVDRVRNLK
jgi:hypothetical protein